MEVFFGGSEIYSFEVLRLLIEDDEEWSGILWYIYLGLRILILLLYLRFLSDIIEVVNFSDDVSPEEEEVPHLRF